MFDLTSLAPESPPDIASYTFAINRMALFELFGAQSSCPGRPVAPSLNPYEPPPIGMGSDGSNPRARLCLQHGLRKTTNFVTWAICSCDGRLPDALGAASRTQVFRCFAGVSVKSSSEGGIKVVGQDSCLYSPGSRHTKL